MLLFVFPIFHSTTNARFTWNQADGKGKLEVMLVEKRWMDVQLRKTPLTVTEDGHIPTFYRLPQRNFTTGCDDGPQSFSVHLGKE